MLNTQIYNTVEMVMTKAQERAIERLIHAIRKADGADRDDYEFKEIEVSQFKLDQEDCYGHPLVFLYTVVGRVGDEGSMAEAFARYRRNIAIGPRAGLQLLNPYKRTKKGVRGFHKVVNGMTER